MISKQDSLESDNLFINKVIPDLLILRMSMLIVLENYVDEINDWMSRFDKEELDEIAKDKLIALIIFLAKSLTITSVFKDKKSDVIYDRLGINKIMKSTSSLDEIISEIQNLHMNTDYYYSIIPILNCYKDFSFLFLLNKLLDSSLKLKSINFKDDFVKAIKKAERPNYKPKIENEEDYYFYNFMEKLNSILFENFTENRMLQTFYKGKSGTILKKMLSNPFKITVKPLYWELKEVNIKLGLYNSHPSFDKKDFLIHSYDLFRILSCQNYPDAKFNHDESKPLSEKKKNRIKHLIMRDWVKDR